MKTALVWIVALLALAVGAFGVAWLIGSRLPVAHRAELSRTVGAPVDVVWRRIEDVASWTEWRDDIEELAMLEDGTARVSSQGDTVRYRIERPGNRVLATEIVDQGLPYGGRWIWKAAPAGAASSKITIVEEGEVYDPLFRFFSRYVFGHEATIEGVLDRLEASFSDPTE